MIYLNIFVIILLTGSYIAALVVGRKALGPLNRKEHKLYFLHPLAEYIYNLAGLDRYFKGKLSIRESLRAIHVGEKDERRTELYWYGKISMVVMIIFLFNLLSILFQIQEMNSKAIKGGYFLDRPATGEGERRIELNAKLKPTEENNGDEEGKDYLFTIPVTIEEQGYTDRELEQAFDYAKRYLNQSILGDNKSLDAVYGNLHFIKSIPGTGIMVEWKSDDLSLIGISGEVHNDGIDQDGVITLVTAILSYGETKIEYIIPCHIMPKNRSQEEQIRIALERELKQSSEDSITDSTLKLPETVDGYQVEWEEAKAGTGMVFLLMGFLLSVLVWICEDRNLEQKVRKRNHQMLIDYPEIINKYTLLINAGSTVKQAWVRISEEYERKRKEGVVPKRYAYEEMLTTARELRLGVSEVDAYEKFGKRAGLLPYMKFSALIVQNLRKGSKGMAEILYNESLEAFEERKEAAKRLGEEAGTKLLFPMMLMLIIVFCFILIPAFISFRV